MKRYKPTSASRRGMTVVSYGDILTASEPHKALTRGNHRPMGHNHHGRITTPHKGGGNKRLFREIDFTYNKKDIEAKLETIEYDPNRSGFIGCALYADGERRYVLVPKSVKVGQTFIVSDKARVKTGNRLPLSKISLGTFVYNIELQPGAGARMVRSAGSFAEVIAQDGAVTQVKLPSGEVRKIQSAGWATIGSVSNDEHKLRNMGKAGKSRHRGIRPTVRGSAMNPVDHPHGGGEGRQGISLRRGPKTRYGKLAYGVKTRTPKKYSNKMIVARRITKRNQSSK